jgi:asparagine synthetase B (glutamine-hydrolysing)
MRAVLAVASRGGGVDVSVLSKHLLESVPFPDPRAVCVDVWTSADARLAIVLASNEGPVAVSAGASGCVWTHIGQLYQSPLVSATENLARDVAATPGRWSAIAIDGRARMLVAATSPSGAEPLFYAVREGCVYVSSSARAAAAAVGWSGTTTTVALTSMVNNGFVASRRTPFDGVESLPPGSALIVDDTGRRVHDHLATILQSQRRATDAELDELHDAFVASFQPLRAAGQPVNLSLSGGKDSRLVLAGLLACGVEVRASTLATGAPADVEIATEVARVARIQHELRSPAAVGALPPSRRIDLYSETVHTLRLTDGMLHGYKSFGHATTFRSEPVTLAGGGGEVLRGGYGHGLLSPKLQPPAALVTRELHKGFGRHSAVIRPEATIEYDDILRAELAERYHGLSEAQILDRSYLDYRSAGWLARSIRAQSRTASAVHPACDNALMSVALRIDPSERSSERPLHELMRRLLPKLAALPFADDEWGFQRSLSQRSRRLWRKRTSKPNTPPAAAAPTITDWRDRFNREPLAAEITSTVHSACTDTLLGSVLDATAFDALRSSPQWAPPRSTQLAFNTYSAAVLATGDWLSNDITPRPIDVPTA